MQFYNGAKFCKKLGILFFFNWFIYLRVNCKNDGVCGLDLAVKKNILVIMMLKFC